MAIGNWFFVFLIVYLGEFYNAIDRKETIIADKKQMVEKFCAQANIDDKLMARMLDSLQYYAGNYYFSLLKDHGLFEDLPLSLRYVIAMNINDKALGTFKFFKLLDKSLLGTIIAYFKPIYLDVGEFVYHKGETANEST